MSASQLDLGPQSPLPHPAQLYFYSSALRAVYSSSQTWRETALFAAGDFTFHASTLSDPSVPAWMGADYGLWQLIVIEGTTGGVSSPQWLGNLYSVGQTSLAPYPGKVHQYFGVTAGLLAANVLALMPNLTKVAITGHSLGGAVGLLLAHNLNAAHPGCVKMVTTFGSPRVGNALWALGQPWPILRFQNVGDVVPFVPPRQGWVVNQVSNLTHWGPCQDYYPAGYGLAIGTAGDNQGPDELPLGTAATNLLGGLISEGWSVNASAHSILNYARRLRQWIGGAGVSGKELGINLSLVDAFQKSFSVAEGLTWGL